MPKWIITNALRKDIIERLSTKMESRPEELQELYQLNIDFVNKKINKQKYLDEMDCLLQNTKGAAWGERNEGEPIFIGHYCSFFDLYGSNVDYITKKNILSNLSYLLHEFGY